MTHSLLVIFGCLLVIYGCNAESEIHHWLAGQSGNPFCKDDSKPLGKVVQKFAEISDDCSSRNHTTFSGLVDQFALPKGNGALTVKSERSSNAKCLVLPPTVVKMMSVFKNGLPHGKTSVSFADGSKLVANFNRGVLHGLARQYRSNDVLQLVGTFRNGVLDGPVWLMSYDFEYNGAVMIRVSNGAVEDRASYLHWNGSLIYDGKLLDDTKTLTDITTYKATDTKEEGCILTPVLSELAPERRDKDFVLPLKFRLDRMPFGVYRTKFLYFNRVAKAGTQGIINLMMQLQDRNR